MTTKLALYNGALRELGERRIAALTENRESRRHLDDVYSDAIRGCLEDGLWTFALRTSQLDYSPSIEPDFGYRRAFTRPDDFVRTAQVCQDAFLQTPLTQYTDEGGLWYADLDTIFIQYVSDAATYGGDMSLWTQRFIRLVECDLAERACLPITNDRQKKAALLLLRKRMLDEARSQDAMAKPTKFPPVGSWVQARASGWMRRFRDER